MQINRISPVVQNRKNTNKNIVKSNNTAIKQNKSNTSNTSFKGGVDSVCLKVADLIENGGLFISFTLQDMLGTNLPRPLMGLRRNKKENNGEQNKSFALKEMVREFLTGPSMFIIPMGLLKVGKPVFGKTVDVPMKVIKSLGDIHAANPLTESGKAIGKEEFYKNAFSQILKNAKEEEVITPDTIQTAEKFANKLINLPQDKKAAKDIIGNITDEFTTITKQHASNPVYTDFTVAKLSGNTSVKFNKALNFMQSYADDVVEKTSNFGSENISENITKFVNKKVLGRLGMIAGMYAAVMLFLQVIPRIYNKAEGEKNAGLKGLMKEETFNNSAENKNTTTDKKQDKANPSFGSAAGAVEKLTGNGLIGRMAGGIEFDGCNVSFPLLLGIMTGGILLPRTLQAKDEYDREEILRRDLVTCATMCFAEKELRKGFSKLNETKSGLVLAAKDSQYAQKSLPKKVFDYLRPIKGIQVLNSEQIVSKYSGIDKYKDGIKGFCDYISNQGGNLSKVFSVTDESKSLVNSLLEKEGHNIANADNNVITDILSKADPKEIDKITSLFKDKNNPWVTKAKTLNARFTALSVLVLVPVFLGFLLPWINEKSTKKRIAEKNQINNVQKNTNANFTPKEDERAAKIFSDIRNLTK
ncbi:MAG: hypothetical protein LUG16_06630 [Candidatus Gastranaerophilales bacterium]|nr:hypothetical protein [Candidatus Gastranaerophilales bacterium]